MKKFTQFVTEKTDSTDVKKVECSSCHYKYASGMNPRGEARCPHCGKLAK